MTGQTSRQTLLSRMRAVIDEHPDRIAVREHNSELTFAEFGCLIAWLYDALQNTNDDGPVGLLLDRSAFAYAAMWACLSAGRAYVPLNTSYPDSRLQNIIDQAGIRTMINSAGSSNLAERLNTDEDCQVEVSVDCSSDRAWWKDDSDGDVAYILFTSGSTGQPKGVPISYGNLLTFLENILDIVPYELDDVCSQVCELSFDVSVEEIYAALLNGCTLCPARQIDLFNPAHYVRDRGITVWISVPSLARVAFENGVPIEESLSSLRLSVFNGEALTAGLAQSWQEAAPNTEIINTYGPTECTVAVTTQPWSDNPDLVEADVISLGNPLAGCTTGLLVDKQVVLTADAQEGTKGELLLATPQMFSGYTDPSLTPPFVSGSDGTSFYRTGDWVLWRGEKLFHLGRIDHQVKIGGHRIELLEIEHQLRRYLGTESLAIVASPSGRPTELVLFLAGTDQKPALDRQALGLPGYMMPRRIELLDSFPTNASGKLDRIALQSLATGDNA